ncbi:MAG: hypothetical protein IJ779_09830 [Ruminococcus sp.]|nr:hypothetical protein [Ruminococcus sp.]
MNELKKDILDLITLIRTDGAFDEEIWKRICESIERFSAEWKETGSVPCSFLPYLIDLASDLAGGSRFVDEKTAEKIEDASIYLCTELMPPLLSEEDYQI